MTVEDILENAYNSEIAEHISGAFREVQGNFLLKKWKPSELDSGHFVEGVRRLLELELSGHYTPFNKKLAVFDEKALAFYENQTGHESYRVLIPRILKGIYNIRSKRGAAHISEVSPNEMDATLILYSVKWVLAELVRLNSGLPPKDASELVSAIVQRETPLIWKEACIAKVLDSKMQTRDQILLLLYDRSPQRISELQQATGYKNITNFRKVIRRLHASRLIHHGEDQMCTISPTGLLKAETIMKNYTPLF